SSFTKALRDLVPQGLLCPPLRLLGLVHLGRIKQQHVLRHLSSCPYAPHHTRPSSIRRSTRPDLDSTTDVSKPSLLLRRIDGAAERRPGREGGHHVHIRVHLPSSQELHAV